MNDEPSFITREVYDETRYTPETRRIIDEEFKRRAARVHLAWLMWCFEEGYKTAEDRAIMENWFGKHQDNATDEATRQSLLAMADEILATWTSEVITP